MHLEVSERDRRTVVKVPIDDLSEAYAAIAIDPKEGVKSTIKSLVEDGMLHHPTGYALIGDDLQVIESGLLDA
jgi:hypothetical protein